VFFDNVYVQKTKSSRSFLDVAVYGPWRRAEREFDARIPRWSSKSCGRTWSSGTYTLSKNTAFPSSTFTETNLFARLAEARPAAGKLTECLSCELGSGSPS